MASLAVDDLHLYKRIFKLNSFVQGMERLLAFYNPGKDKTKVRYGRSAFQAPVSIERTSDWYFELPVTE